MGAATQSHVFVRAHKAVRVKSEFYRVETRPSTYSVIGPVNRADSIAYHVCFCCLCIRDSLRSPKGENQKCGYRLQSLLVSLGPGVCRGWRCGLSASLPLPEPTSVQTAGTGPWLIQQALNRSLRTDDGLLAHHPSSSGAPPSPRLLPSSSPLRLL